MDENGMQKVLNKRILRDLRTDFFRYFALFLLIVLGMYLIISIVGAAESVIANVREAGERNKVEDGEFSVFVPLDEDRLSQLAGKGVTIAESFYLDYEQEDHSTLRIFKNRNTCNRIDLDEGVLAEGKWEVVLEKHYAENHNLKVGSRITIGGEEFMITGTGSVPDYDAPFKNMSDVSVESNIFGLGFVSNDSYEALKNAGKQAKTEEYVYSYILNGAMEAETLKDYLSEGEPDRDKITDSYFLEMLEELEEVKTEMQEGIAELSDGTKDLDDGLSEMALHNDDIMEGIDEIFVQLLQKVSDDLSAYGLTVKLTENDYHTVLESIMEQPGSSNPYKKANLKAAVEQLDSFASFKESMKEYTEGTEKAADGSEELLKGMNKLREKTDEIMKEYFSVSVDNVTGFVERKDNPRIAASIDDVLINKQAGLAAGVIIMALFTYVISVFVIHKIEQESPVIGALYALGVTKRQLMKHYLKLPVIITLLAGLTGTAIGFSSVGAAYQTLDTVRYFSLPVISTVYPPYLLLYGVIMPPLVAALVNYLVINKKLSEAPLTLIRNEQKLSSTGKIKIGRFGFITRFRIRQFFREIRTGLTVIIGMFIAFLILMLGLNCYAICHNMSVQNKKDTAYHYMYTYKYPTKDAPAGGEACYGENLQRNILGYDLEVTLLGIDANNKYFDFDVNSGMNKVALSKSAASKFHLQTGDELVLYDDVNEKNYAFTVDKIVPYSVGLYVFMDIDGMRELFGKEEDYYNVVMSDQSLDIDPGRLYAVTTREDIQKNSDVFLDQMWSLIICMVTVSVLIFVVVMYLMLKVMIDRSSYPISLLKIFGFRNREIRKLYLDGNFVLVAFFAALCIPISKRVMDALYPYLVANVACGLDLRFSLQMYAGIYISVLLCYLLTNILLVGKLKRMIPADILKNRE